MAMIQYSHTEKQVGNTTKGNAGIVMANH